VAGVELADDRNNSQHLGGGRSGTTYRHIREGKIFAVTRQWTIWRIMSHDLHHGGQLALILGLQGIDVPEPGDKGGHLTPWSLTEPDA